MPTVRSKCARCGRSFKRLDTHLRVSATCRNVERGYESPPSTPPPSTTYTISSSPRRVNSNSAGTLPGNSNSVCTQATSEGLPATAHPSKHSLRLPKTVQEWDEADVLLSVVTPLVLQAISAEEKNTVLCDNIHIIMSSRFGVKPSLRSKSHSQSSQKQHDRALKKATQLKNEARRALQKAKRQGGSDSEIMALSGRFLSLLRDHSRLKRASARRLQTREATKVRQECHRNFWRFARDLLDDSATSQISPDFSADSAYKFFTEVYNSSDHQFVRPCWMPLPPPPDSERSMDMGPITREELSYVIKRSRASSSPSPLDQISYSIFKRCPSLHPALLDLFNRVVMEGVIPSAWKVAAVKLIPKGAASQDPSSPANFRPIALTPTISKLFSGILKDRWLCYMKGNNYLNSNLQKAFLPTIPGVTEHQAKLASIIKSAKHRRIGLWL